MAEPQAAQRGAAAAEETRPFGCGDATGVAQIFNLPYRRFATCESLGKPERVGIAGAPPIGNRRYGRLKICATKSGGFILSKKKAGETPAHVEPKPF